jgi:hypothetical protein
MRTTTSTGICAAIIATAAVVVTAQAQAPQSSSSSSDKKTVVTGCLKEAPGASSASSASPDPATPGSPGAASPGPASSPPAAASSDKKFVLENATQAQEAGSAQTYALIANSNALSPHAGKKLELTGTLEPSSGSSPTLRVESGKIVAASCSQ